jgi:predicted ATP-dependent protease
LGAAAAVAAISALEAIPVRQDQVLIGNLAVNGEFRSVRATLQRIETAAALGFKRAVVPKSLEGTLVLDVAVLDAIDIRYCATLTDVLAESLDDKDANTAPVLDRLDGREAARGRPVAVRARR